LAIVVIFVVVVIECRLPQNSHQGFFFFNISESHHLTIKYLKDFSQYIFFKATLTASSISILYLNTTLTAS